MIKLRMLAIVLVFLSVCFNINAQVITRQSQITTGEYFVGSDPGVGKGIPISILNPSTTVLGTILNLHLATNEAVFIRFKNGNGIWSAARATTFTGVGVNRSAVVNYVEYFVGSDPGKGRGTSVPITAAQSIPLNILSVNLSPGQYVHLRTQDIQGRWSSPVDLKYPTRWIRGAEVVVGNNPNAVLLGQGLPMSSLNGVFGSGYATVHATLNNWNRQDTIWVRTESSDYLWSKPIGDVALYNSVTSYSSKLVSFGTVEIGSFKDTVIKISNTGKDTLKITSILSTSAAFNVRPTSNNILPSQFFFDTLRFTPSSAGTASGLILVSSNALSLIDTLSVSGNGTLTAVEEPASEIPKEFSLKQNFPNPFNPSTTLQYSLPITSRVSLRVYNALGQVVAELVNREQAAGWYGVKWNAEVSSGIYFYRINAVSTTDPNNHFVQVKKMLLLK